MKNKKGVFKELFMYVFFGVLTTAVNFAVYNSLYYLLDIGNSAANIAAWCASVLFAFVTNRRWVFGSGDKGVRKEAAEFFLCRGATGILDLTIMIVTVDGLGLPAGGMKALANVLVVALNYFCGKLWIFSK